MFLHINRIVFYAEKIASAYKLDCFYAEKGLLLHINVAFYMQKGVCFCT